MGNAVKINLGISMGDPNGVGLEIILKVFEDRRMFDFFTPILCAPHSVVQFHKNHFNINISLQLCKGLNKLNKGKLNVVDVETEDHQTHFGTVASSAGKCAVDSLRVATKALKEEQIDALVTAPIHKQSIQSETFTFPGHTQFLAKELQGDALMLMLSDQLRIALVTDHIPVKEVSATINAELLTTKANQFYQSLQEDFGLPKPKIAVLGMNPHAGDAGVIGDEDDTVLRPVLQEFQEKGKLIYGPYAADSFFGSGNVHQFDGVLAMYHDQGLIPFKTLSFGQGVNFTAGLSGVRTSPDHGTAFDIAGKGIAEGQSFKAALFAAKEIQFQRNQKGGSQQ
jgi:4-hydroxythreonine-4-phosphate dehydrogenase